jgi:hypothetical protein
MISLLCEPKMQSKAQSVLRRLGFRRRHLGLPVLRTLVRSLTKTGVLPRAVVGGIDVSIEFVVRVESTKFRYTLTGKDPIGSVLYWQSWRNWEPAVVNAFRIWLPHTRRLLDIGANTGFYTLFGTANGSEVIALEPNATTFSKLERNVQLNHFEQRCKLFQVAAGLRSEQIPFYLHDDTQRSPEL